MISTSTLPLNDLTDAPWRTSTFSSGHGGACVEVAKIADLAAVRDSKNRNGGVLVFPAADWTAFLSATDAGAFDLG